MDASNQLRSMQEYIANVLDSTGEFTRIDRGYTFKGETTDPALRAEAKRQIFCEIKPEYAEPGEKTKFLIITHADTMPGHLFAKKLESASRLGIYTAHVLFRYVNSTKDDSTKGPLFRRFVLEEDRKRENAGYRKKAAFNRDSLSHYPQQQQDRFRILRRIERDWVNAVSNGLPLYYQPESNRLKETLKRYCFKDIVFKGDDGFGRYREEKSVEIKDPKLVEDLDFFTIQPMRQRANLAKVRYDLEQRIKQGRRQFRFSRDNLLIADTVSLPNIEVETENQRIVRHKIGLLGYAQKFGLDEEHIHDLVYRIGIQTENWDESSHLLDILNSLLQNRPADTHPIDPRLFSIEKIIVESRSRPGKTKYHISKKTDLRTGKIEYGHCTCEGYLFSKKPKGCCHIKELNEIEEKE